MRGNAFLATFDTRRHLSGYLEEINGEDREPEIKKENGHSVEAQLLVIPSPAPAQLSPLSSRSIIVAAIRILDKTCATYRAFLLACRVPEPLMSFTFFSKPRK